MSFLAAIGTILARLLPILIFAIPIAGLGTILGGTVIGGIQALPNIAFIVGTMLQILPILIFAPLFTQFITSTIESIRQARKQE